MSKKWYTETASKQPAAHPPERPQKPSNPTHHHRGLSTGGKQPKTPAIQLIITGAGGCSRQGCQSGVQSVFAPGLPRIDYYSP
jgi:hypothetical protein